MILFWFLFTKNIKLLSFNKKNSRRILFCLCFIIERMQNHILMHTIKSVNPHLMWPNLQRMSLSFTFDANVFRQQMPFMESSKSNSSCEIIPCQLEYESNSQRKTKKLKLFQFFRCKFIFVAHARFPHLQWTIFSESQWLEIGHCKPGLSNYLICHQSTFLLYTSIKNNVYALYKYVYESYELLYYLFNVRM